MRWNKSWLLLACLVGCGEGDASVDCNEVQNPVLSIDVTQCLTSQSPEATASWEAVPNRTYLVDFWNGTDWTPAEVRDGFATVSGVSDGDGYRFRISTRAGTCEPLPPVESAPFRVIRAPVPPDLFAPASVCGTNIMVTTSWQSDPGADYTVEFWNGSTWIPATVLDGSASVSGVDPGTGYRFRISASKDGCGGEPPKESPAFDVLPGAGIPTLFAQDLCTELGTSQVSWTPEASVTYDVEVSFDGLTWQAPTSVTETSAEQTGLVPGSYWWRIRSVSGACTTPYSVFGPYHVSAPPVAPTVLETTNVCQGNDPVLTFSGEANAVSLDINLTGPTGSTVFSDVTSPWSGSDLDLPVGSYQWTVTANGASPCPSVTSAPSSFSVTPGAVQPTGLNEPNGNAGSAVLLQWSGGQSHGTYAAEIDYGAGFVSTGITDTTRWGAMLTTTELGTFPWRVTHSVAECGEASAQSQVVMGTATPREYAFELQESYVPDELANNLVLSVLFEDGRLYAGTNMGLSVSEDNGITWRTSTIKHGLPDNTVNALLIYDNRLFVATQRGLAISDDHGESFSLAPAPITMSLPVTELANNDTCLFVGAWQGLYRSCDGASTFTDLTASFDLVVLGAFRTLAVHGDTVVAATSGKQLFVSVDGGETFSSKAQPTGDGIHMLAFAQGKLVAITDYMSVTCNIWTSPDLGDTWSDCGSTPINVGWPNHASSDDTYVYLSSNAGFSRLNPTTFEHTTATGSTNYTFGHSVTGSTIYSATSRGVDIFDSAYTLLATRSNALLPRTFQVRDMVLDGTTQVIGTPIGWFELDPSSHVSTQYTVSGHFDGLLRMEDDVRAMLVHDGRLYVGSFRVYVYDQDRQLVATLSPGAGYIQVYSMVEHNGKIIAGGNFGVVEVTPDPPSIRPLHPHSTTNSVAAMLSTEQALFFTGYERKLFRSYDGGVTLTEISVPGLSYKYFGLDTTGLAVAGDRLLLAAAGDLLESWDHGDTWSTSPIGCGTGIEVQIVQNLPTGFVVTCRDGTAIVFHEDGGSETLRFWTPRGAWGFHDVLELPDGTLFFSNDRMGIVAVRPVW